MSLLHSDKNDFKTALMVGSFDLICFYYSRYCLALKMKNDEGGPASLSPADSGSKIVNDTCSAVSATAEITTAHFMESKSPDMT